MAIINGTSGNDDLEGTTANDVMNGRAGNDLISGDEGNDIIRGGAGDDIIAGGPGNDIFVYERNGTNDVVIDLGVQFFSAILNGAQANQGNGTGSSAQGIGYGALLKDGSSIAVGVNFSGLDVDGTVTPGDTTDDITSFHIHRAPAGSNGPVVFGFISPNSDTNGDLDIDPMLNSIDSVWDEGEGNADPADELANLLAGNLYFNAHTSGFPGGEIRGQILAQGTAADRVDVRQLNISSFDTLSSIMTETLYEGRVATEIRSSFNSEFSEMILGFVPLAELSASDFLFAGATNDNVQGSAGNDDLFGGDGDDSLVGRAGADQLHGGAGTDRAQYTTASAGVTADLMLAGQNTGDATGDSYVSIENIFGSNFDDDLRGDGEANTIWGGNGDDLIQGRAGDDDLRGGNGNDAFIGDAGADTHFGGAGIDVVAYLDANSGITADLQNSMLNVGFYAVGDTYSQIETLSGSAFGDSLRGNGVDNTLIGGAGRDFLIGRNGDDTLEGGEGNDVLTGGNGADIHNGGGGIDQVSYIEALSGVKADMQLVGINTGIAIGDTYIDVENLRGSRSRDDLRGDGGANKIEGFEGDDNLTGRGGDDELRGGTGDDLLNGGAGNDLLIGSLGNDRFRFNAPSEGVDEIRDFQTNRDTILLDDLGFSSLSAGAFSADNFIAAANAADADDFIVYDAGSLYYDADGNGAGAKLLFATLTNTAAIDADDFLVI